MKICFVGPASSAHIMKWCNWFSSKGHEVHVISFVPGSIEGCQTHIIELKVNTAGKDSKKIKYLFVGTRIWKIVKKISPDIISVHYASSYGVSVALSPIRKYTLSIWGSDIYQFPKKSIIHKLLLKLSLKKASQVMSTSVNMANEAKKYVFRSYEITPFGVNIDLFNPNKRTNPPDEGTLRIGNVKALADIYGIQYIIEAAEIVKQKLPKLNVLVIIAGDGPDKDKYIKLAQEKKVNAIFLGQISQKEAATVWANLDIAVIPSLAESFGVAALEAQSSGIPVIISAAEGLIETTKPGITSIVTEYKDSKAIAEAIIEFYNNPLLMKRMGLNGREYVAEKYELNMCFSKIEHIFEEFLLAKSK